MSNTDVFFGELIGTGTLVLLGGGVCAAVNLRASKAFQAGWVAIAFGWGLGVMAGAYIAAPLSGGHLNPAVTLGLALGHKTEWSQVPIYIVAQILGAMLGATAVWLSYFGQFEYNGREVRDYDGCLQVFSTAPEIRRYWQNVTTEVIATLALVLFIAVTGDSKGLSASGTGTLMVALLVVGIGLSLGGPTGYAINPARDLGPRIMHQLLPIPAKGSSDWSYSWVPVAGPLLGGVLAAAIYNTAF